jgi:hypothetical protein
VQELLDTPTTKHHMDKASKYKVRNLAKLPGNAKQAIVGEWFAPSFVSGRTHSLGIL